ncbi:MAG: hypothetical protein ACJAUP_000547 [Cellvibrionaceae bacterium]|jgi:hypothetical protein
MFVGKHLKQVLLSSPLSMQGEQGSWAWDQWVGKPVHKRLIRFKNGKGMHSNDGDVYSIVR